MRRSPLEGLTVVWRRVKTCVSQQSFHRPEDKLGSQDQEISWLFVGRALFSHFLLLIKMKMGKAPCTIMGSQPCWTLYITLKKCCKKVA